MWPNLTVHTLYQPPPTESHFRWQSAIISRQPRENQPARQEPDHSRTIRADTRLSSRLRMAKTGDISPNRRSKAGCQQCRRRKRKCDETHPSCTSCVERGLPCNWQRLEPARRLIARRQHRYNKDFTVPEEMRPLVNVFAVASGSSVQTLLSHFCAASPLWITSGGEQKADACLPLILPVAQRNPMVLNCVLALAAGDLSKYSPPSSGMASLSHGFYGQAVAELHSELNNELASTHSGRHRSDFTRPLSPRPLLTYHPEDDTLLAVLLLCVHEVGCLSYLLRQTHADRFVPSQAVNFTNTSRLLPHINAAATLCHSRSFSTAKDSRLRGFLFEIFCYIASLTSFSHGRNLPLSLTLQVFNSPFLSGSQYQGILLGQCSKTFCFILQVAMLTCNMDPNDILDETIASELRSIEAQLADPLIHEHVSHGSPAVVERTTAQLYRLACLIHVRRTLEPDLDPKDPVLQDPVTQFIRYLEMLPSTSPANGILCWPLVVAGLSSVVTAHQRLITGRLRRNHETWRTDILSTSADLLSRQWKQRRECSSVSNSLGLKPIKVQQAFEYPIVLL